MRQSLMKAKEAVVTTPSSMKPVNSFFFMPLKSASAPRKGDRRATSSVVMEVPMLHQ